MTDLAAVRERHVEDTNVRLFIGDGSVHVGTCAEDRQSWPCDAAQLLALLADTPSVEPAGLDGAWRAVEAVLPDGWLTLTLSKRAKSDIGPYSAAVHDGSEGAMAIRSSGLAVGHGSTPEVALQRLAARLLPTQASDKETT